MSSTGVIQDRMATRATELARRAAALEAFREDRGHGMPGPAIEELIRRAALEEDRLEAALERLRAEGEIDCASCGKPIAAARLRDLPSAARCDGCVSGFDRDFAEEVRAQHDGLRALLAAIAEVLLGVDYRSGVAVCLELVSSLRGELHTHFALEERGGYLRELLASAPRLTGRAEALRKDHARFLQGAAEVLEILRRAARDSRRWPEVARAFGQLRGSLLEHETAENRLIHEALLGDIGPSD